MFNLDDRRAPLRHRRIASIQPRIAAIDTRAARPPPRVHEPFYWSREWRDLLDRIVAKRGRRCEDHNCKSPDLTNRRIFGDHMVEIRDGGAKLDESNVMLRCGSCHTRKTNVERAKRVVR
jgi:hypothetical protein